MAISDDLRRRLSAAHQEALRVGDSPIRAERLADQLEAIPPLLPQSGATEDVQNRIRSALADAVRALRRDDDGPGAAKHIHTALRLAEDRPRPPSPFLD